MKKSKKPSLFKTPNLEEIIERLTKNYTVSFESVDNDDEAVELYLCRLDGKVVSLQVTSIYEAAQEAYDIFG